MSALLIRQWRKKKITSFDPTGFSFSLERGGEAIHPEPWFSQQLWLQKDTFAFEFWGFLQLICFLQGHPSPWHLESVAASLLMNLTHCEVGEDECGRGKLNGKGGKQVRWGTQTQERKKRAWSRGRCLASPKVSAQKKLSRRDGSAVQSICGSYGRAEFGSQYLHCNLQ